ncbi:MAG: F0F1 ATP synthase subunit A [Thermodesulfovibrionales bacterium]|nr:F0F1 ATP synthase subunit A [Thermodesulfovibrionales bacterium]
MESPTILGAVLKGVPTYVSYSWLAMGFLTAVSLAVKNKLSLIPKGVQNVMEVFAEFFLSTANNNIGHHYGEKFYPLLGTIFLYIVTCNLFGLIPYFDSPTSNINTTASMALPVFLLYQFYGFKVHGIGYIKHFLGPLRSPAAIPFMIFMFFLELIGHLVRPVTLSVRLFGNMMAKHVLLTILGILAPVIIPVAILGLGTLIGFVQGYVFMLLTTLYLAGAVEEAH